MEEMQQEVEVTEIEHQVKEEETPASVAKVEEPKQQGNDGYAILDLHLNQFLSFIADEFSFLPCAIYKPRIDVYLNNKLVYKSRVLSHENDIFGNVIRLRIRSPNSVVTLKLYECVQLRLTEHCVDELIKPVLKDEPMDEVLISTCDIEVGLLLPFKRYDMVCAFRVNPMFQHYNPGGILYYPTFKGKPFIDNKRACCACRVCVFLASLTNSVHKKMLNKYFDFRSDTHVVELPNKQASAAANDSNDKNAELDKLQCTTTDETTKDNTSGVPVDGEGHNEGSGQPVMKPADHMDYMDEEEKEGICDEPTKLETFELNVKKVFFTREGCTCCRLADVPRQLRGVNYSPCLCCHDYQVCCEHSVESYYYTSISMMLVSKHPIDFKTEVAALMNNPITLTDKPTARSHSLCSIVTRFYEVFEAFGMINKHLGFSSLEKVQQKYLYLFITLLVIGFVFDGKMTTVSCFILGFLTMYFKSTSTRQYNQDFGDVIQTCKRLTFSGQGLEKIIKDIIEEDESNKIEEPANRYQRNMVYMPKSVFVDDVKVYSKLNASLKRCENISIKTMTNFLSGSIPKRVRKSLLTILDFCEGVIWCLNSILAIIRRYGLPISLVFFSLGILSLRYAFWIKTFIKTSIILLGTSCLMENNPTVRLFVAQLKHLVKYVAIHVRRREWFLNVESFL